MRTFVLLLIVAGVAGAAEPELLVDDFSEPGLSALGTRWEGFTDRVMGGRSTMEAGYRRTPDGTVLAMAGSVSLENNGGFIQVRLPLTGSGTFDASDYAGIAVVARGRPGSYRIHLRTRQTRLPWQLYSAPLEVTDEWRTIVVPFAAFEPDSVRRDLDRSLLTSLAIVAYGQEFDAEIELRRIALQ